MGRPQAGKQIFQNVAEARPLTNSVQYEDKTTKSLMMLPADYALIQDKNFKKYVELYAKDSDVFFKDFAAVIVKLFELGVPFPEGTEKYVFKTLD